MVFRHREEFFLASSLNRNHHFLDIFLPVLFYSDYYIVTVVINAGEGQASSVPVIEDENSKKLVGVVARLDILREKLNEGFLTIGKREALSRT
jgi:CBS domain-containing protein